MMHSGLIGIARHPADWCFVAAHRVLHVTHSSSCCVRLHPQVRLHPALKPRPQPAVPPATESSALPLTLVAHPGPGPSEPGLLECTGPNIYGMDTAHILRYIPMESRARAPPPPLQPLHSRTHACHHESTATAPHRRQPSGPHSSWHQPHIHSGTRALTLSVCMRTPRRLIV